MPRLHSGRFDNQFVLNGFGCKGQNVSPALLGKAACTATYGR